MRYFLLGPLLLLLHLTRVRGSCRNSRRIRRCPRLQIFLRTRLSGTQITDKMLLLLAQMRDDGKILPIPTMKVYKVQVTPTEAVAVVEVYPADAPPVRYEEILLRSSPLSPPTRR